MPVIPTDERDRVKAAAREALKEQLGGLITRVRDRRGTIEDDWLKAHQAWSGIQGYTFYVSEFRHFIPMFRKFIERLVHRTMSLLIPVQSEFIDAFPGNELDTAEDRRVIGLVRFMDWLLGKLKARRVVEQLCRSFYLYGRAVGKVGVQIIDTPEIRWGKVVGSLREIWPTWRAVDIFNFYVWPETVADLDDASLMFEDVMLPWSEYEEAVKSGIAAPINRDDLTDPIFPQHMTSRLDTHGLPVPTEAPTTKVDQQGKKDKLALFVSLTEAWAKLPGGAWLQVWFVWNVPEFPRVVRVLRAKRPRHPYRMSVSRELPSQHYTPGVGQDMEALQVLLNDQFNQGEEARAVATGPPVVIDTSRVRRADTFVFGYRRKWYGHPEAVKMLEIPDTSPSALAAVQFTMGLMNDFSGSSVSSGQPPRGLPRGSQAASQLIGLSQADVNNFSRRLEEDILTPTLQDLYDITQAFIPENQIIQIPGAEGFAPEILTVSELRGGWRYKWAGAIKIQDLQTSAQNIIQVFQNVARIADVLPQQGFKVDWATFSRVLFKDSMGERRLANVIREMTPEEREQEAAFQAARAGLEAGTAAAQKQPGPASSGARGRSARPAQERK